MKIIHIFPFSVRASGGHSNAILEFIACQRAAGLDVTGLSPLPPAELLEIRNACPAAEGRDTDLLAARTLIETPAAYATALLGPARSGGGAVRP